MFKGVFTAIITPFKKGSVDETALRDLVEWQIQEGIHGLVPCGTTGESATLTDDEWEKVIKIVINQTASRVPVIAGAGSNNTAIAIAKTKKAFKLGADATLQVTPYYNKPMQEGLYQHFKAVAETADLPVVLYNVPGRTSVNMLPETVARLSKIKNIVAVKEASGNIDQIKSIKNSVHGDFSILSGDDPLNYAIYSAGGVGAISVVSNVVPGRVAKVWDEFKNGNIDRAKNLHEELQPLNKILFIETNPIPTKTALSILGKCREEFRLPLTQMSDQNKMKLKEVLDTYKLQ